MAKGYSTLIFSGMETLNTGFPTEIPDNHWSDTLNMIRREDGLWENRKGIAQFGADVGSGVSVHSLRFWKTQANVRYLTVGTDDDLYSYAEGATYNDGTFTARKDLTNSTPWDSVVYRGTILIENGSNTPQSSTDNATFTDRAPGATVVNASIMEVSNDFVSFFGTAADPNLGYLSAGAPTNIWEYDTSNTVNIDIGNSENVTGALALGAQIVVFKRNRVYSIDLASLERTTLDFNSGCESNRAIMRTNLNEILFAGRNGVFSVAKTQIGTNTYFGSPESEVIKSLYDTITSYATINSSFYPLKNYAIWNAETSLGQICLLKHLDYDSPIWTYFTGVNATDWTLYQDSSGDDHLLFGDSSLDKVWELFVGRNDNGAPILSRLATKRTDFGLPGIQKHIGYIDIYGYISENAEWTVELYANDNTSTPIITSTIDSSNTAGTGLGGLGSSSLGTDPLGGLLDTATGDIAVVPFYKRIDVFQDVEKLQIMLRNNQVDARVIYRAAVVYYQPRPVDQYANEYIS